MLLLKLLVNGLLRNLLAGSLSLRIVGLLSGG
jgi:hypothetical protein